MRFKNLVFFILLWQVSKCLRFAKLPPVYETISLKLVKNIVKRSVSSALYVNTFSLHGEVGLKARLAVFNRTFDISAARLRTPPSIIDRNIEIRIFDRNQSQSFGYDRMRYYVGRVADISNSKFRGYVGGDGQLAGGLVDTGDEVYHIEPARRYFQSRSAENSLVMVYPGSRVLVQRCGDLDEPCFADMARGIPGPRLKRSREDFPAKLSSYTYGGPNHFNRICSLHLIADHTFFAQMLNDANSIHEMMFFVEQANVVFTGSDFNGDGNPDGLQLQVQKISLFGEEGNFTPHYFLSDETLGAKEILEKFSMFMGQNDKQHCLAVLFTARDFSPTSLLGLSYMADSNFYGLGGGICELVSKVEGLEHPAVLNTAMITTINGGMVLTRSMTSAVLSHLLGHSFGAPNDEVRCQESAESGGTYLMFPFIGIPVLENNMKFSPCSLDRILPVLRNKGWCLEKKSEYGFCGDGVVQAPEECDCGMDQEECGFLDHCCAPAETGEDACKVRRELGYVCSPLTSACCSSDSCKPLKMKQFCSPLQVSNTCFLYTTCNGASPDCPQIGVKGEGTPCAGGAAACHKGYCNSSLCDHLGYKDCECVLPLEDRCKVCCRVGPDLHTCQNILNVLGSYHGYRLPGSPCMNNTGYCTYDKVCQPVTAEGMVDSDAIGHKKFVLYPVSMWIVNHWLHILLAVVFLVLLFLVIRGLVLIYRMSVVTYQFTQAVKMGMRRIWAHEKEGTYPHIVLVCAGRLLALFPGVPIDEALEVASHHGSESSMIKLLLGRGYPIRTAFFSTEILEEYQKAPPPI